jgi:hypothetical protein
VKLPELERLLLSIELPLTFKLSDAETVVDVPKFVENHLAILKGNPGNERFMTYFERLKKIALRISKND